MRRIAYALAHTTRVSEASHECSTLAAIVESLEQLDKQVRREVVYDDVALSRAMRRQQVQ